MTAALAWLGALVAFAGMVSYFTLAVRWPDLRDGGHLNVALAAAGVAVALLGVRRAFVRRRHRWSSLAAAALAVVSAGFLAAYVYWLSYRLPSAEGVVAVGSRAPGFALRDQTGALRSLDELRGKKALLVFFRGHW